LVDKSLSKNQIKSLHREENETETPSFRVLNRREKQLLMMPSKLWHERLNYQEIKTLRDLHHEIKEYKDRNHLIDA